VFGDGGRDALGVVSGQAGAQQVVGVGGVAVRAAGADRGAAVAARGEHGAGAFEQDGAVAVEDLRAAGEVDGGGAAAGGLHLGPPGAVVGGAQPGPEQIDHAGLRIVHAGLRIVDGAGAGVVGHGRAPVPSWQRWQAVKVARRR
jgi:hypothetical protein